MDQSLLELEKKRKAYFKEAIKFSWVLIPLGIFFLFTLSIFGVFMIALSIAIYNGAVIHKQSKAYKQYYKETIIQKELEQVFTDVKTDFSYGFNEDDVESYGIVKLYDRFFSDDLVEGSYKNCRFRRSDILIQDVRSNGKSTTIITTFQGPWMIFEFPKQFSKYTVIKEKEFLDNGKPSGWLGPYSDAEKIKFEDERFNEEFVVYSTEGQEAFYLLTPHFMEALLKTQQKIEGRLYFGFVNNQFHVAIDNHENAFEASLWSSVTEQDGLRVKREINMITGLIELLKLEQNI